LKLSDKGQARVLAQLVSARLPADDPVRPLLESSEVLRESVERLEAEMRAARIRPVNVAEELLVFWRAVGYVAFFFAGLVLGGAITYGWCQWLG
jgi:hypothetical protein